MSKEEQDVSSLSEEAARIILNPTSQIKSNILTTQNLQSLELEIDDGLPKFKLNEPGPTALASSVFQQNNMINDESDQSFVVLGRSTLDCIKETSLNTYVEIQKKSNSTDHSSLISVMSSLEVEENLKKVLDENLKLKETLKQNNTTIKQQFNTITKWQKEVMEVCDNHKQKFVETKELINKLKSENDELREKIISPNVSQSSSIARALDASWSMNVFSLDNNTTNSPMKKPNYLSTENLPALCSINSSTIEDNNKSESNETVVGNEQELVKKIDLLSIELTTVKNDYSKLQELLEVLKSRYVTDIEHFSQQLKKTNKGLEDFKKFSDVSNATELEILVNKCCEKDEELKDLKDIVKSLEDQQIRAFEENAFAPINLELDVNETSSKELALMKENVEYYNEKMNEMNKCFASQSSRYLRIQEILKESIDIIQSFENEEVLPNNTISAKKLKIYKDNLCNFRKKLLEEQVQSINDKLTTIKFQKLFQKILSNYYSTVLEVEILRDEYKKLEKLQAKATEESSQKLGEIKKQLDEERKALDNEKAALLESLLSVRIEKKWVSDERDKLQAEQNDLSLEKGKLAEEKASLIEEKTSLDRQSKLYEAEEGTLQNQKKTLQKKCDDLNNEIIKLKKELNVADIIMQGVQVHNVKLKENDELISAYKIQLEMYQKEFDEMRVVQKNLQDQLQSLSKTNIELRTENDRLGGSVSNEDAAMQQQQQRSTRGETISQRINSNWITCPKCKDLIPINHIASHFNVPEQHQHRFCERCRQFLVPGKIHNTSDCTRMLLEFD